MKPMAVIMALFVLGILAEALGISKSYDIVPYKGCIAQTGPSPNNVVSQYYRNTLDSLTDISWWCGDTFTGGLFNVVVADSAMPTHQIAHGPTEGRHATQCWAWLDFPLTRDAQPVRGRTYLVAITRQGNQPISFAYDTTNPYDYGCLSVGGTAHPTEDLALRVYGLMNPIDSTYWGYNVKHINEDTGSSARALIAAGAETAGVAWNRLELLWDWVQPNPTPGSFSFDSTDDEVQFSQEVLHCKNVALLNYATSWAGTHGTSAPYDANSPPINLFEDVDSDSNYLGNLGTLPGLSIRGASRAARYSGLQVEMKLVPVR